MCRTNGAESLEPEQTPHLVSLNSTARMYSRFIRAIVEIGISFGQTASHSPSFEQLPNPSASIRSTIATTRAARSTSPCGSSAEVRDLRAVKSAADAFLHAATQAPQPMHAAASIARSAIVLRDQDRVAVRRAAAVHRRVAAGLDDAVERAAVDDQILDHRERPARATARCVIVSPSLKRRMCSWQTVLPRSGPCGMPLTTSPHVPQMPSRQSESNAIGSSPLRDQPFVDDVEHFEERHVRRDALGAVRHQLPGAVGPACRQTSRFRFSSVPVDNVRPAQLPRSAESRLLAQLPD